MSLPRRKLAAQGQALAPNPVSTSYQIERCPWKAASLRDSKTHESADPRPPPPPAALLKSDAHRVVMHIRDEQVVVPGKVEHELPGQQLGLLQVFVHDHAFHTLVRGGNTPG